MKSGGFFFTVALTLLLLQASSRSSLMQSEGEYVENELLLKVQPAAGKVRERLQQLGAQQLREFSAVGWIHLRLPTGMSVTQGMTQYRQLPGVEAVQPNFIYCIQTAANDPRFGELYGLNKIKAPSAWDTNTGSANVVVAVIDAGVDYNHEDLSANMWRNPGETGTDSQGHDKASNGVDDDGNGYVDDLYGIDTINHDSDPWMMPDMELMWRARLALLATMARVSWV